MAAPIRFLSGRQQQQKIGIEGSTEDKKVLEVVGRTGIGTTSFEPAKVLDVRGDAIVEGTTTVGKLEITGTGDVPASLTVETANVTGVSTFGGAVDVNAGLDVDGQADLDEVVVAGVATFSSAVDINSTLDVDGDTQLDDLTVAGVATFSSAINATDIIKGYEYTAAPSGSTVTLAVTVASKDATHRYNGTGSGNGYVIDGIQAPFLTLTPGRTYRFTNDNTGSHPFRFYLEADRSTLYSSGVDFQDTYTEITISDTTPEILHYQCSNHAYMGNAVQTNSNTVVVSTASTFSSAVDINAGLDVDGQTDLDELIVAGVATFQGAVNFDVNSEVNIGTGVTILGDNLHVTGIVSALQFIGDGSGITNLPGISTQGSSNLTDVNVSGTTTTTQFRVSGIGTAERFVVSTGGLDVDGQTDLDELIVSGVSTFQGNIVAATAEFSGNVTIGGTLIVEDKTNVDSIGLVTARTGVRVLAGGIDVTAGISTFGALVDVNNRLDVVGGANIDQVNATGISSFTELDVSTGGLDVDGQTDLDELQVAGVSTFSAKAVFNTAYPSIDADNEIQVGTAIQLGKAGVITATSFSGDGSNLTGVGTQGSRVDAQSLTVSGISTFNDDVRITAGGLNVTGVVTATTFSGSGASLTGVDAATLDGVDSTSFLRSDVADVKTSGHLTFNDYVKAKFGTDEELEIFHNGTDSYIEHSGTGDLFIRNYVDDADILIQTDAGDGSLTTYLRADGDTGEVQLYHYGSEKLATKSTGVDVTGTLSATTLSGSDVSVTGDIGAAGIITATGMVLVAGSGLDVGAVGVLTALSLDISTGGIDVDGQSNLDEVAIAGVTTFSALADVNNRLDVVGGANIDQVNVTGIASFKQLDVSTGGLDVDGQTDLDELVVAGIATFQTHVELGDSDELRIGNGDDLQLYHNGSHSFISNTTGNLNIRTTSSASGININSNTDVNINLNNASETAATFAANGAVSLYHNGISKFATSAEGVDVTGRTETDLLNVTGIASFTQIDVSTGGLDVDGETQLDELVVAGVSTFSNDVTFTGASYNAVWDKSDNALEFAENAAAKFGEDADLEIYHATHSYIKNKTGSTAEIRIGAETIRIGNVASTETYIKGEENGEVILYHDNVAKLNTNIGGITVTGGVNASGVVTASSFSGDGSALTGIAATDHVSTFDLVVAGISTFNNDVNFVGDSANIVFDKSQDRLEFADTAAAVFGSGDDLKIYHNSHSYIDQTGSNNLHIRNTVDDQDVTIQTDDGSGGAAIYFQAEGASGRASMHFYGDRKLYTNTGGVDVTGGVNATGVVTASSFSGDGSALTGVGTAHVSTFDLVVAGISTFNDDVRITAGGLDVTGTITADGLDMEDDQKILLGNSDDVEIYYNQSNNKFRIDADCGLQFGINGEKSITAATNGNVELYYDDSKKLETTGAGVTVTGTTFSNQLNVSGIATIYAKTRVKGGDLFVQDNLTGVEQISHRAFYNNSYYANDVAKFVHKGGHPQVAVFGNYANVADNHGVGAEVSIVRSYSGTTGSDSGGAVSTAGAQVGGIKFGAGISNQMVQAGFFGAFLSESGTFSDTSKPTDFRFYTNPNGAIVPTEKVRITSEGNVGIGSTIPTSKLDIVGDVQVVGVVTATSFSGDGSALTGIGTQGPDGSFRGLTVAGISTFNDDVRITAGGLDVTGITTLRDNIFVPDNTYLRFGDGNDLSIAHVSSVNTFASSSIHGIKFLTQKFIVNNESDNETGIEFYHNAEVGLYYNGVKKLETTSDGIGVSGIATATGINLVAGSGLNAGNTGIITAVGAEFNGTSHIKLPAGSTAQRPSSPTAGDLRYNSDDGAFEGYTDSWGAIGGSGGAEEVDTNVSSTSAVGVGSFATASFRSAEVIAQIVQIDEYQVGKYLMIHDGTTVTVIEQAAVATGDSMLGSFDGAINGSNAELRVNMVSSGIATVTTKISTVTI